MVIPDTNFLNKIAIVAPSATFGNMIDTTDASLISIQELDLNGSNIANKGIIADGKFIIN